MRLLFISNLFPDAQQPWRGLDNATLLHEMRALRPEADIRVLCMHPGHGFWLRRPCLAKPRAGDEVLRPSFHRAPYVPRFGGMDDRLFAMGVRHALKSLPGSWRPEALLVPWLFPDGCAVARLPELEGIPLVSVAQGSDVHQYLDMPMRRRAILSLSRQARWIITRSEDLRQRLLRAGAPADRVITVYNGVDVSTFRPGDRTEARRALDLPVTGKLALFVGNFVPVKGIDLLILATALARARLSEDLRLVMIGGGPLEAELIGLAAASRLSRAQVILAGRKSPVEVAQFMRAADLVCLSSHNEGVPNVGLEAMASGRPMLTTDVGGIGEVMRPCPEAGLLVPNRDPRAYADAMLDILGRKSSPETLANYARRFRWEVCAHRYWDCVG